MRSFFRLPVSSDLGGATITYSYIYMTDEWAASDCSDHEPVDLYSTGPIRNTTDWANQPAWGTNIQEKSFSFGHSGCPVDKNNVTWTVTSVIQDDANEGATDQTFGLRAPDESNTTAGMLQWKQFRSGSSNITMSTRYNLPPAKPDRSTSPGGICNRNPTNPPVIGNDDVTFYATPFDADGDNSLTTRFIVLNSAGNTVYDSKDQGTSVSTGDNTIAALPIPRSVIHQWGPNGATTAYTYHWYALVSDSGGLTSTQPTDNCYFTYNPLGPSGPTVSVPSGQLGQQVSATFTAPAGCSPTTSPCPVSYTYQLGASQPVNVTDNVPGTSNWAGDITINQVGPIQVTVYGVAAGGNLSEAATTEILGSKPQTPYPDGYYTGYNSVSQNPDLLTVGTGNKPSLWLSPGTGFGALGPPADIGSLGTYLNSGSGDGPGDWSGAEVLHGDFTGNGVQDVLAYYPTGTHAGSGQIIGGPGNTSTLQPYSGNLWQVQPGALASYYCNPSDHPGDLVAAGNASEQTPYLGSADLIASSATPPAPATATPTNWTYGPSPAAPAARTPSAATACTPHCPPSHPTAPQTGTTISSPPPSPPPARPTPPAARPTRSCLPSTPPPAPCTNPPAPPPP